MTHWFRALVRSPFVSEAAGCRAAAPMHLEAHDVGMGRASLFNEDLFVAVPEESPTGFDNITEEYFSEPTIGQDKGFSHNPWLLTAGVATVVGFGLGL